MARIRRVADRRLDGFDDVDHAVEDVAGKIGEVARVSEHGFFHERVAGTDVDAVSAGNAGGPVDFFSTIPEDARMVAFPVDSEGFVDLDVLAGFDAAATEDALIGVVTIEGIGVVLLVGLVLKRARLMLHVHERGGVMDRAVLVIVVADGAIEIVVLEDAVEGFSLGDVDDLTGGFDDHAGTDLGAAGADELSVDADHAGVAALNGAHLGYVADLRDFFLHSCFGAAIEEIDEEFAGARGNGGAVDCDSGIWL